MNNNLILEKIKNKDSAFIKNILKENFLVYEDINNPNVELFSAYKDSNFVGIIGLEKLGNLGLLRSLVVVEKYRNKGYGKGICHHLLDYAKSKKIKGIYLLTVTAKKFFEKLGFKIIKRKDAPKQIQNTEEFSNYCPNSAFCLKRII